VNAIVDLLLQFRPFFTFAIVGSQEGLLAGLGKVFKK
jgi:hypothetical protein